MAEEDWLFGSGDVACDHVMALQFTDRNNRWMTVPEERAVSLSISDLRSDVDPAVVSAILYEEQLIPKALFWNILDMLQRGSDRKTVCEYLFKRIPSYLSLQKLITVLERCGYSSSSAQLLLNSFRWNSAYISAPKSSRDSNSSYYSLYTNLKHILNNANLSRPRVFLRKLANISYEKMVRETDPERKQSLAENCVAIISAETDTIAITFDQTLCKHELFSQIESLSKETSNTLISDLVYYGRLANAYAIAKDYDMCEQMLNEATCKAYIAGTCIEFVHLVYMIAYVTLWQFEHSPTPELRSKILMWCRVGLKCVEEDFVKAKNNWRRIFMLKMIYCLLGLSNKATVIQHCQVNKFCIIEAKQIIGEFEKYLSGIETRRRMTYYVAKARVCELEKSTWYCLKYLKLAFVQAKRGKFEESKFIKAYFKRLFEREHRGMHVLQPRARKNYKPVKGSNTTKRTELQPRGFEPSKAYPYNIRQREVKYKGRQDNLRVSQNLASSSADIANSGTRRIPMGSVLLADCEPEIPENKYSADLPYFNNQEIARSEHSHEIWNGISSPERPPPSGSSQPEVLL